MTFLLLSAIFFIFVLAITASLLVWTSTVMFKLKKGPFHQQGQPIANAGMVGKTINPHVHFAVINKEETSSTPISFNEVRSPGVPEAGKSYTSENKKQ